MADSPFVAPANTSTAHQGSVWAVLVQPSFPDLVFEAAQLLSRAHSQPPPPINTNVPIPNATAPKPAHLPSEFALNIKHQALALAGPPPPRSDPLPDELEPDHPDSPPQDPPAQQVREYDSVEANEKKRLIIQQVWSIVQVGSFVKTDDRELEATVNLLLTLLLSFFPANHPRFNGFVLQLMQAIASAEGKTTPYGRYAALFTLFNSCPPPTDISESHPPLQLAILSRLADMAVAHPEDLNLLLPSLLRLPSYLAQWNLASCKTGVGAITKVVRLAEQFGRPLDAFNLSISYLSSPALALSKPNPDIDQVAELCIKVALTLADYFDWDLLNDIKPIAQYLDSHPEGQQRYSRLITLLKCPTTTFQQVENEINSNAHLAKVISDNDKSKILKKTRLLSLTELCGARVGGQVTYDEVKQCLGLTTPIEEDDGMEVEEWIINAIKAKLITARLHQPTQVVFITKATRRSFGPSQWKLLQDRLENWGSSINHLIQVVDDGLSSLENNRAGSGHDGNANHGHNKASNKMMVSVS